MKKRASFEYPVHNLHDAKNDELPILLEVAVNFSLGQCEAVRFGDDIGFVSTKQTDLPGRGIQSQCAGALNTAEGRRIRRMKQELSFAFAIVDQGG